MDESTNNVKLNEEVLSKEEFQKRKEELEKQKGVTVVEQKPGEYKTRIQG